MARKNLLTGLIDEKLPAGNFSSSQPMSPIPLSPPVAARQGAIGAVSRSIAELKQQIAEGESLKQRLADGQAVVELDTALIHPAFVNDRLGVGKDDEIALLESIRQHGQQVPILVRPYPGREGTYQIAYGHRRLRSAKALGLPVRAVVRALSDAELVVAQGTENSARADLTFIERAVFAHKLEQAGFGRDVIMAALSLDKTAISKLIAVPSRLPAELIEAIGRAPKTGRDRWLDLVAAWDGNADLSKLEPLLQSAAFKEAAPDQRFELMLRHLTRESRIVRTRTSARRLLDASGNAIGKVHETPEALVITVVGSPAPGFSEFVANRLPALLREFQQPS